MDQLRDGDGITAFQPVTAREHVFRFHFARAVAPTSLRVDTDGAYIDSIRVRLGSTAGTLRDAAVGEPGNRVIALSGEQAKVFEVTVRVREGVLRIQEMSLTAPRTRILFIAQPGATYRLVSGTDPEVDSLLKVPEQAPLPATLGAVKPWTSTDDHDGLDTSHDNCPAVWNPLQDDTDKDAIGDECDNCLSVPNPDQADKDGNGRGDICDDTDGDGVINSQDNCPAVANPAQQDEDQDGTGNLCDPTDSRWSESQHWLVPAAMVGVIVVLTGLAALILRKAPR